MGSLGGRNPGGSRYARGILPPVLSREPFRARGPFAQRVYRACLLPTNCRGSDAAASGFQQRIPSMKGRRGPSAKCRSDPESAPDLRLDPAAVDCARHPAGIVARETNSQGIPSARSPSFGGSRVRNRAPKPPHGADSGSIDKRRRAFGQRFADLGCGEVAAVSAAFTPGARFGPASPRLIERSPRPDSVNRQPSWLQLHLTSA